MKVLIDACVLYPTVMREVMLGCARAGLFTPLWSARISEEWARAAGKLGAGQETVARGEIALVQAAWPEAVVAETPELEATLYLPDPNDTHVLAAAISGGAELIVTMNLKDFPNRLLAEHDMRALHPDAFLRGLFGEAPGLVAEVVGTVRAEAERLSGQHWSQRKLMKKARLPRLGKALET